MIVLKIYYHIIAILKKVFYKIIYGKLGTNTTFRKGFSLLIENGAYVEIGDRCFFNNYCTISAKSNISIGDNSIFGENVKIYDNSHIFKYNNKLIKNQGYKSEKIEIGKNCWIANNVVILNGAKIGDNCVVSVNEVVKENINSNVLLKDNEVVPIKYGGSND